MKFKCFDHKNKCRSRAVSLRISQTVNIQFKQRKPVDEVPTLLAPAKGLKLRPDRYQDASKLKIRF